MGSFNWAVFGGNVAADAKMRQAGDGDVLGFRIAVNNRRKRDDEPLWVNVSLWGKRGAALEEYITRGKAVIVGGPISLRSYDKDGETRTVLEMDCQEIELVGGGKDRDRYDGDDRGGRDRGRGRGRDRDEDPGPDKPRERQRYERERGEGGRERGRRDSGGDDGLPF